MLYVAVFDFSLAAFSLAGLVFFVWCWIAFGKDQKLHPIYKRSDTSVIHSRRRAQVEKDCA